MLVHTRRLERSRVARRHQNGSKPKRPLLEQNQSGGGIKRYTSAIWAANYKCLGRTERWYDEQYLKFEGGRGSEGGEGAIRTKRLAEGVCVGSLKVELGERTILD